MGLLFHCSPDPEPELRAARQVTDTLAEHCQQAQVRAAQAERELANWRIAHPVRAKAHDAGVMRSRVLQETELRRDHAHAQRQRLAAGVQAATQHLQGTHSRLETRLAQEQAPALAQIGELARWERQRHAQEQAQRAQTQALDQALAAFKGHALRREMKAPRHGDSGRQWAALPEALRKVIEDFNRLPPAGRTVVLERMRDTLKRDPQGVEKLTQQLDQGKEHDRGMSR